jgi:hypothetical protein
MDEEQIEKVKQLLTDWNPLGERAQQIKDLENYEIEAIDILFYLDKKTSVNQINKIMTQVISEAYDLEIDLDVSRKYAERIRQILINK